MERTPEMKSVAIIGTRGYPSHYGGFETLVRKLSPYLAERGWDVTVYGRPGSISTTTQPDSRVHQRMTWGIESRSLSTLTYGLTSCIDATIRRPDVALVMNVANGYWLPLLNLRGIPSVVNVDGIEWEREKWSRTGRRVFHIGARLTSRHASRLVCDAEAIAQRWALDFKSSESDVIPYGGDPLAEVIAPEPGLRHRGYVLYVARFVPENSVAEFLHAARILSTRYDVVIVGSSGYGGEVEEQVRRLVQEEPRVRWLGHVSDDRRLLGLWANAGAYFHGHSVGGTNPALVQAMACGAPIVARDTIYNREVLGESGTFSTSEPAQIVESVDWMMSAPARQTTASSAALRRARETYTWDSVCAAYERSLEAAVGPSS